MPRYFLQLAYKGTAYSGFQVQQNAVTVQSVVEQALAILAQEQVVLTGSSRTDAGVHARQNYFHFDIARNLEQWRDIRDNAQFLYKLNAILPQDIVVLSAQRVGDSAHCRFDAVARRYKYYITRQKNPFLTDRAWYFPYRLNWEQLQEAAKVLLQYTDFTSFSKRNTQVKSFQCTIAQSEWKEEEGCLVYTVKANRFLRGMVRALTSTMLQVGREKLTLDGFRAVIEARDCTVASFAAPAQGLFLEEVVYPTGYFDGNMV